jgi:hypothetical protein
MKSNSMIYYTQKDPTKLPEPKRILALKETDRIKEHFEGKEDQWRPYGGNGSDSDFWKTKSK